jgi:hypothetical protein
MTTSDVNAIVKSLGDAGCLVEHRKTAGTIEVRDNATTVMRALRKGSQGQPWIVRFFESNRIKWEAKQ